MKQQGHIVKGYALVQRNTLSNAMLAGAAVMLVVLALIGPHGGAGAVQIGSMLMLLALIVGLAHRNHAPIRLHDDHLTIRNGVLASQEYVRYDEIRGVTRPAAHLVELEVAGTAGRPRHVQLRTKQLKPREVDRLVAWLGRT